jgi:hypothetical protein
MDQSRRSLTSLLPLTSNYPTTQALTCSLSQRLEENAAHILACRLLPYHVFELVDKLSCCTESRAFSVAGVQTLHVS